MEMRRALYTATCWIVVVAIGGCNTKYLGGEVTQKSQRSDIVMSASCLVSLNETYQTASPKEIKGKFSQGLTVKLSIQSSSESDLLGRGITDERAYKERLHKLSYGMDEFIRLKIADKELKPMMVQFENLHGPGGQINLIIYFHPGSTVWPRDNKLTLTVEDPYWNSGIHQMVFDLSKAA